MAKQVCDFKKGKGMTTSQSNEHLRVASKGAYSRSLSGNFDPTREHLNFEVIKGGKVTPVNKQESIPFRIRRTLKKRKIEDPNKKYPNKRDREKYGKVTTVNFIFEGSRDRMREIAFGDQKVNWEKGSDNSHIIRQEDIEKWAVDLYKFMSDKYGEENISAFVVHLDETTPHIHCTLLPIVNNKFNFTALFGTRNRKADPTEGARKIRKFQDDLYEQVNKKWGLDRGDDVRVTGARHRTTEQYRQWLAQHQEELRERIAEEYREIASLSSKNKRSSEEVSSMTTEIAKLEKKVKAMKTMISNLEKSLAVTDPETPEYDDIIRKIQERQKTLLETEEEIRKILDKKSSDELSVENLKRELDDTQEKIRNLDYNEWDAQKKNMQSTAYKEFANTTHFGEVEETLKSFMKKLSPRQLDVYDETLSDSTIESLAMKGNEILATSAALFMGYVDAAVSFSQEHGGGGASPGGDWGRKKDEDDDHFARRCFFMGMKMMRPVGRKLSNGLKR